MNTQHSVWIMAQVLLCKAVIMYNAILLQRTAFLLRDTSVFRKNKFCQLSFTICWMNLIRVFVCYNVLWTNGGDKNGGQMITPVENRTFTSCLEEREVGSVRNLTQLCIPYILAKGGSNVRCEETDWVGDMPDQDSHLLPSFNGEYSIPGIVGFNRFGLQQDNGIPVGNEQLPLTQGCKVIHLFQRDISWQILVDNIFPRCDGTWCSQQHSIFIHSESQGSRCFL